MLALELEADFADIITVKEHELAGGATAGLRPLPPPGGRRFEEDRKELFFSEGERGAMAETQIVLSRAAELDGDLLWWRVELAPRESWELRLDIAALSAGARPRPRRQLERDFERRTAAGRESLAGLAGRPAEAERNLGPLERAYERSVADLAALRLRARRRAGRAAGSRHAVVHDALRPRHDHCLPPDTRSSRRSRRAPPWRR